MAIFRLFINTVFYFCRTSDRYHIFGNILCHDRACTDHGIISDSDTRKDSRVRAYPYVFAYVYRLWYQIVAFFGEQTVIQRCKHCVMTDQRTVTNENAALILKLTARIDEYPLAEMNVFSAISKERRKQSYLDSLTDKLRHKSVDLIGSMITAVDLHSDTDSLLTEPVHSLMYTALRRDLFIAVHVFKKFCCCHTFFPNS